ncbi:PACE efflux transporter [Nitratireductor aquimarinus]|uniref:PACE efflux transporter n=1 Tax=Alphaproteobacteria TaxID=28211 RepID=UPI0019D3E4D1|nr:MULTISPECIES: PACE efflux transporter [Alphaproteobacteria]MBN7758237.1 PACE efflux transporter [Nitratireductor aquimarinus]MBY6000998.1 PACE efflux transporter [Tritonibacter mobilis]MBY6023030.1 PACE efflux transporter [Nitratireductor sp. DP7N14-4]
MRTAADRIRHAVSFELIALLIVTPIASWLFGKPMFEMGIVVVVSATVATAWNYIYNLGFDHALRRFTGSVRKTVLMRVVHAVLFEGGLLVVLMPFTAALLGVPMVEALFVNASFALFYLVYAFVFNWAYDLIFPVPEARAVPENSRA